MLPCRPLAIAMLTLLPLVGCQAGVPQATGLGRLDDVVIAGPGQAARLTLSIHQAAPAGAHRYGVKFVQVLDWEAVDATLTNTAGSIPTLNQSAKSSLDTSDNRKAALSFSPVKPAGGYTLTLNLKRKDGTGTYQVVASGSNANFTINPGANAVSVTLTPTAKGDLLVDISKPSLVLNTLTSNVSTQSAYGLLRVAGDATGGNLLGTSPTSAAFKELSGMDVDASGTLYVADAGNNQIRTVGTSGPTAILAGSSAGTAGSTGDGGPASSALLSTPRGLSRDPVSGNLVFCDAGNNRVRMISASNGSIVTLAGGGTDVSSTVSYAINAQLNMPFGVVADSAGNMFITERGAGRVLRLSAAGALTTVATLTPGGIGPIAIDRTNNLLWVGEGNKVRLITGITGASPTLVSTPIYTTSTSTDYVTGLAFDQVGTLYLESTGDNPTPGTLNTRIFRLPVDNTGAIQAARTAEAIAGTGTSGAPASYSAPTIAVPNALNQQLAGVNWCGLAIDMSASNAGATLSGILYAGNSYASTWGQVIQLTPTGL